MKYDGYVIQTVAVTSLLSRSLKKKTSYHRASLSKHSIKETLLVDCNSQCHIETYLTLET